MASVSVRCHQPGVSYKDCILPRQDVVFHSDDAREYLVATFACT